MHKTIQAFARNQIKSGLLSCTEAQTMLFKRMYSHKDLEKPVGRIVDDMHESKLETALDQVERTVIKNSVSEKQT